MKPEQWIVNGEVGTSSKTIWAVMMGAVVLDGDRAWANYSVPHDPDDFSRCWKLLNLFPEWRKRLSEVATTFPEWVGFVREWDTLTAMFESNLKQNPKQHGYSPGMYDLMFSLVEEGRKAAGWIYDGAPGCWHRDKSAVVQLNKNLSVRI